MSSLFHLTYFQESIHVMTCFSTSFLLWMNKNPLYVQTAVSLSIDLLMNTARVLYQFIVNVAVVRIFEYKYLSSYFFQIYAQGVELALNQITILYLLFAELIQLFPTEATPFYITIYSIQSFYFLYFLNHQYLHINYYYYNHPSRCGFLVCVFFLMCFDLHSLNTTMSLE